MKKYSINDFFSGKVDIRCKNKEQKMAVLKECDKHGVVWNNDQKATDYVPCMSVIEIDVFQNGKLTQSDGHGNRKSVDFDKIVFPKRTYYRIVIDCDGDTTKATMTINGKETKGAVARRNPKDKFDWKKGAELAFCRLWGRPTKKTKCEEVKRHAKPGEYIRIVNAENANGEKYCNGDILLVTAYYDNTPDGWVIAKGSHIVIGPEEYVVLEGYRQ